MSYEKDLNIVMTAINMANTFNMSQSEEEELIGRIKGVYSKAEAWDRLKTTLHMQIYRFEKNMSGFPYVDSPIENALVHYNEILESMNRDYESEAE